MPGSKYSTVTAIAVITTAVFNSTQPPVYDVPSIMLSPLQTQSHLTLTTVQWGWHCYPRFKDKAQRMAKSLAKDRAITGKALIPIWVCLAPKPVSSATVSGLGGSVLRTRGPPTSFLFLQIGWNLFGWEMRSSWHRLPSPKSLSTGQGTVSLGWRQESCRAWGAWRFGRDSWEPSPQWSLSHCLLSSL